MINVRRIYEDDSLNREMFRFWQYEARVRDAPPPPTKELENIILQMQKQGFIYILRQSPCWVPDKYWLPTCREDIMKVPFDSLYFSNDSIFFCCDVEREYDSNIYTVFNFGGEWDFDEQKLIARWREADEGYRGEQFVAADWDLSNDKGDTNMIAKEYEKKLHEEIDEDTHAISCLLDGLAGRAYDVIEYANAERAQANPSRYLEACIVRASIKKISEYIKEIKKSLTHMRYAIFILTTTM